MTAEPQRAQPEPPAPSLVRSASLDRATSRSFLADVVIEHGPRDVLGRLFLMADTVMREKGILVSFSDCEELVAINKANPESWKPILPLFDPRLNDLDRANTVVVVGRDGRGRAVFAHASRLYPLGDGLLRDEIDSLRIFYADPAAMALDGEALQSTAPVAGRVRGDVVFGGALWIHPDVRGKEVLRAATPLMRALSFTLWQPQLIFSFMFRGLIEAGIAAQALLNVDWGVQMTNTPINRGQSTHVGLVWIDRARQLELFPDYLRTIPAGGDAQVDRGVVEGATEQKLVG